MGEKNNQSTLLRGLVTLTRPIPHHAPIRRITEHAVSAPTLAKPIIGFRKEFGALCIRAGCARIKGEFEFDV